MNSLFRITFREISAGVGWINILVMVGLLYLAFPIIGGAEGEGVWISRGQGACLGVFLSGCYSILLGARLGGAQVARGANLYYRGCGMGEFERWIGICLACVFPLAGAIALASGLLMVNYWAWNGLALESMAAAGQYAILSFLLFFCVVAVSVGVGARVGETAGAAAGLVILFFGMLFPTLLSIAAAKSPGLELIWVFLPHLYALDWSPSVVYLWGPAGFRDFSLNLAYGIFWNLALGSAGFLLFSASPDQHE